MRSKKEIMEIMDIFNQRDPNPRCELDYQNAYTLLVAVVLSAQATDKGVNKATKALGLPLPTPRRKCLLSASTNSKNTLKQSACSTTRPKASWL